MNRKLFTINTFYIIVFALTLFRGFSFYFCCMRTFRTNKIKSMLTVNKLILFVNSLAYIVCSVHLIFCNSSACFTSFFLLDGAEYRFLFRKTVIIENICVRLLVLYFMHFLTIFVIP